MRKSAFGAGLLAALFASIPIARADAQQVSNFVLKSDPGRVSDDHSLRQLRVDPMRLREDAFGQPFDLFGIPLTGQRTLAREKGSSFGIKPAKGIRAVAKLRF